MDQDHLEPMKDYPRPPFNAQSPTPPGLEKDMSPRPQYLAKHYLAAHKLAGKVSFVTGGDSGIGRAVALLYAKVGATVAFTHLSEERDDAIETKLAVERGMVRTVLASF